jgi:hypothetical protein
MKEAVTDLIINGRENNPSEIIRKIVLFYYPGQNDLVDCILQVLLNRYRKGKRKFKQQTNGVVDKNKKKRLRVHEPDKLKLVPEGLLRQIASYLTLPKQVKTFMATNRSHRDILQGVIDSYYEKMESERQALLQRYENAYDYYVIKRQKGESEEDGYADMTDWIIYEMLDTSYFTISECLVYIEDEVINDDLEMRINDMRKFIDIARERHTLTSQDYDSIFQCFLP